MTEEMARFVHLVDRSAMPLEKKLAALSLVQRLSEGERVAVVLKDLAEPLGLTPEVICRCLTPEVNDPKRGDEHPIH